MAANTASAYQGHAAFETMHFSVTIIATERRRAPKGRAFRLRVSATRCGTNAYVDAASVATAMLPVIRNATP